MHRVLLVTLAAVTASSCAPQRRSPLVTWLPTRDYGGVLSARANDERADEFVRRALSASKAGYLNQPHGDGSATHFAFRKCNQGPIATRPFQSADGNHIIVIVTEEAPSPVSVDRGSVSIYFRFDPKTREVVDVLEVGPAVH